MAALCRDGRIPGACKQGRSWRIPSCAEKPSDSRVKKTTGPRLPLPIGISDYRLASSRYYYIDKTMMIKEFLDERPMVSLFTRPRRFGKTLNMDMLRTFFCLAVNSILDSRYSEYFGFTPEEVKEIARYYGAQEKYEEICAWYDGYRFGSSEIFNPWSVINYFRNHCRPQAFWQSTGNNEIIGEILADADADIYEHLNELLQGKSILTYIDTGVIYPQIRNNPSSVYSFLLVAGYLKALKAETAFGGDYMCEVSLPNREIAVVYNKEILQKLEYMIPQATAVSVQEAPD